MTTFISTFKKAQNINSHYRCRKLYSEGRPLPLLWNCFPWRSTFLSGLCLKKLAEGKTPRKGKWAAVAISLHTLTFKITTWLVYSI